MSDRETGISKTKERKETFKTSSGIEIKQYYTHSDREISQGKDTSLPAEFPYTRAFSPPCTGRDTGPCVNMPDLPARRNPTSVSNICWNRANRFEYRI